jgi:hypothetical protein
MATQRELAHQRFMRVLQLIQDAILRLSIVACYLIVGGTIYLCVRELAGKTTITDMAFKIAADWKADKPIAVTTTSGLAALCGLWASIERFLRRRYIKKWHPVVEQYQLSLDPRRGSSRLTKSGTTQREDI